MGPVPVPTNYSIDSNAIIIDLTIRCNGILPVIEHFNKKLL